MKQLFACLLVLACHSDLFSAQSIGDCNGNLCLNASNGINTGIHINGQELRQMLMTAVNSTLLINTSVLDPAAKITRIFRDHDDLHVEMQAGTTLRFNGQTLEQLVWAAVYGEASPTSTPTPPTASSGIFIDSSGNLDFKSRPNMSIFINGKALVAIVAELVELARPATTTSSTSTAPTTTTTTATPFDPTTLRPCTCDDQPCNSCLKDRSATCPRRSCGESSVNWCDTSFYANSADLFVKYSTVTQRFCYSSFNTLLDNRICFPPASWRSDFDGTCG